MQSKPEKDLHDLINVIRRVGKQVESDISTLASQNEKNSIELGKFKKLIELDKVNEACDATTFSVYSSTSYLKNTDLDLENYKIAYYLASKDARKYYERPIVGSIGMQYIPTDVDVSITIRKGVKYDVLRNTLSRLLKLCDEQDYFSYSLGDAASGENAVYSNGCLLVL